MAETKRHREDLADVSESARRKKGEDITRLNVNINAETADALRRIAEARGISYTEAVRRAIAVWAFVEDELAADRRIQVFDPASDTQRELVFVG